MYKKILLMALLALFTLPDSVPAKEQKLVAHVLAPFIQVYRERRPESEIIIQAKKGDKFVVAQVGEYWARVYVPPNDELGWVELGMENPKVEIIPATDKKHIVMLFVFPALLLISIGVIIYLLQFYFEVKRKKVLESVGGVKGS